MLAGVKRKYPKIDFEKTISSAQSQAYYPDDMIKFGSTIGGHKAGRSIVKTCLALAVESGINPKTCKSALEYLTKPAGEPCFGYYYERDLIVNRSEDIVFHCVSVTGNPDTKQLLGYVEYYSVWRMIICLSDKYEGERFSRTYALNPISGDEIEMQVELSLSPEDIAASCRHEKMSYDSIKKAFKKVISIGMESSYQREEDRVLNEAMQYAFKNCGAKEGENLTEEQIAKLTNLLMEKLNPFIIHQLRRPKRRS
jgi:hypothetical protein